MKKAQVTIFIVIGLVVIIAAGLIFYIRGLQQEEITAERELMFEAPYQVRPIQEYVQQCLEEVTERSVYLAGSRGGRIYPVGEYLDTGYTNTTYYYDYGEDNSPSLEEIEAHIAVFVEDNLDRCSNFSIFESQGFEIETRNITANVSVSWNSVFFRIYYPIEIRKGNSEYSLLDFADRVHMPFGMAFNISQQILEMEFRDPDYIDLSLLSQFDANVTVIPHDEENVLYSIICDVPGQQPFSYLFANRFEYNSPPRLSIPDTLTLTEDVAFSYQVIASDPDGDRLTYHDDISMFDISDTGMIEFTPGIPGEFDVTITVRDSKGKYDQKVMKVIVNEN
ncbi:hypothetical protein JW968_06545 [Candidatus Woesearchaeota archaeon]|nr:hypothetical protein [Candidatus Woesearchaeota archaeon]